MSMKCPLVHWLLLDVPKVHGVMSPVGIAAGETCEKARVASEGRQFRHGFGRLRVLREDRSLKCTKPTLTRRRILNEEHETVNCCR